MTFNELLKRLKNNETFEEIVTEINGADNLVECCGNEVCEDDNLYEFLDSIGVNIEEYFIGYVLLKTNKGNFYEVPHEYLQNRFDVNLPAESKIIFDVDKIFNATKTYK